MELILYDEYLSAVLDMHKVHNNILPPLPTSVTMSLNVLLSSKILCYAQKTPSICISRIAKLTLLLFDINIKISFLNVRLQPIKTIILIKTLYTKKKKQKRCISF